jgi:FAD/FMN-containing dehydrogenase
MSNDHSSLTGRVIFPNDPAWEYSRKGFCERADFVGNTPKAVVYVQNLDDIKNAMKWAQKHSAHFSVRSGGHSFEGYSSFAKDGVIVDMSEIQHVRTNSKMNTATVGAGIDMLELSERLADSGKYIPLATGPSVALGGFVQGGGFGFCSRLHGLACDNLIEAEVITADGHVLRANKDHHSDLFWAVRGGGGGNFGVLTECVFNTHDAGLVAIFKLEWTWDSFEAVLAGWQDWFPTLDDGYSLLLSLTLDGNGVEGGMNKVTLYGQYTAPQEQLGNVSSALVPMLMLNPISVTTQILPYVVAARLFFGADLMNPQWAIRQHGDEQLFKSSASVAFKPFPPEAITKLKQWLDECPVPSATPSQPSMVQLLAGGGAIARVPLDSTAVYQRDAHFIVQYDGYWTAHQDMQATFDWVVNMRKDLLPYAYGGYVNYHDATLVNPMKDYYGVHATRLKKVKKKYDPKNFFNYPQSIK